MVKVARPRYEVYIHLREYRQLEAHIPPSLVDLVDMHELLYLMKPSHMRGSHIPLQLSFYFNFNCNSIEHCPKDKCQTKASGLARDSHPLFLSENTSTFAESK